MTRCLELRNNRALVGREDVCLDSGNTQLLRDRGRGDRVITRNHHDLDPLLTQGGQGVRGRVLDWIGEREYGRERIVDGEKNRRSKRAAHRVRLSHQRVDGDTIPDHQGRIAEGNPAASDLARHPLPGNHLEVGGDIDRDRAFLCRLEDR